MRVSMPINRLMTKFLIGMAIFLAVFFLSGCAGGNAPTATTESSVQSGGNNGQNQATSVPMATSQAMAARVNDQAILMADFERTLARRLEAIAANNEAPPSDMQAFRKLVLDTMISQVVIDQAAIAQGIQVTDAEVEAEIQSMVEVAGGRENFLSRVAAEGMTEEEYRKSVRDALLTQKMRDTVTANICDNVDQVRARHILVADEAAAKQIVANLNNNGDFVALAAGFSLDITTRQNGGDLGWFARGQLLQPALEDAAFSLPINGISQPIQTDLGYHILQVLERASDRPIDPETCFRLTQSAFERWQQDLLAKAKIERLI
jgi:peptidyl-prolyl cis-trans isomerase C